MTAPYFEPREIEKAVPLIRPEERRISDFRAVMILARTGWRRVFNRYLSFFRKKTPAGQPAGTRGPTSRPRTTTGIVTAVITVLYFVPLTFFMAYMLIGSATKNSQQEASGALLLDNIAFDIVSRSSNELDGLEDQLRKGKITQQSFEEQRRQITDIVEKALCEELGVPLGNARSEKEQAEIDRFMSAFLAHKPGTYDLIQTDMDPRWGHWEWTPAFDHLLAKTLSLILLAAFLASLLSGLAGVNRELGRVEWSFEWLCTMPVHSRSLMIARAFEDGFTNIFTYFMILPVIVLSLWFAGWGWLAIPIGLFCFALLNLLLGSVSVLLETSLRMRLSPAKLKNLQAIFGFMSALLLMITYVAAFSPQVTRYVVKLAKLLPDETLALPTGLPLLLGVSSVPFALTLAGTLVIILGLSYICVTRAARLVSGGYVATTGHYQGKRQSVAPVAITGFFRGALWKEKTLLSRDRTLLVQTIGVPIIIIALNFFTNRLALSKVTEDFARMAALAFGVGSYSLLFGAINILGVESKSLWLVYSFPRSPRSFFYQKAAFWGFFSCLFALFVLIIGFSISPEGDLLRKATLSACALLGVAVFALIAAGFSVIGTDLITSSAVKKIRTDLSLLFMALLGIFAGSFFLPDISSLLIVLSLMGLFAYALWQKSVDALPYLLDPTDSPPPALYLADGVLAVIAFFFMQAVLVVIFIALKLEATTSVVIAYGASGAIVGATAILILSRRRIPHFWSEIGILRRPALVQHPTDLGSTHRQAGSSISTGLILGLLAAGVAGVYLFAVSSIPALREGLQKYIESTAKPDLTSFWFVLLAVVLAPIVEEFLFRGLLFRGFLKTMSLPVAVTASAAIFAIVHPPISMIPVFGLGCAAALAFHRTGLLMAPIVAHFTYNGMIVLISTYFS
ncbi:MAG: type II CAAX endopeptidase family protein [Candidatus Brocadiia bacterium]